MLGLKRTTLAYRMKKLGIERPRYRAGSLEMPAIPEQSKTSTELDRSVAAC
jgi:hypothetical protein